MNKINILAVMSLGLFLSTPMYAPPQDPALSEPLPETESILESKIMQNIPDILESKIKIDIPESEIRIDMPESKNTLESEEKRKVNLEERKEKVLKKYRENINPNIKEVAQENKKKFKRNIKEKVDNIIDDVSKDLGNKQKFKNNLDKLSLEMLKGDPLALKIAHKAETNAKEANAQMSEKFQNLIL